MDEIGGISNESLSTSQVIRKFTRTTEPKTVITLQGDAYAKAQYWHL
jgi:hypothetical protein